MPAHATQQPRRVACDSENQDGASFGHLSPQGQALVVDWLVVCPVESWVVVDWVEQPPVLGTVVPVVVVVVEVLGGGWTGGVVVVVVVVVLPSEFTVEVEE